MKKNKLSETENKILRMVALGYANREIARNLYMSTHSVKSYLAVIFRKLNAENRTHLIYIAFRENLLPKNLERSQYNIK